MPFLQVDDDTLARLKELHRKRSLGVATGWRLRGTRKAEPAKPKNAPHNPRTKFSPEVVAIVRRHSNQPMAHVAKIAAKYGMSYSQARRIIRGEVLR